MQLPVARPKVLSTRFLYSIKASEAITLDNVKAENIMSDMMVNIILCRFISSVLDIYALD